MTFKRAIWEKEVQMKNSTFNTIQDTITKYEEVGGVVIGDKVTVPVEMPIAAVDAGVNNEITFNDVNLGEVQIEINQSKYAPFKVKNIVQAQTNVDLMDTYTTSASRAIRDVEDKEILKLASVLTNTVGSYDSGLTKETILKLKRKMDANIVPLEGRLLVVDAYGHADLLAIPEFTSVEKYGSTEGIQNGEVGRIFGFTVILNQLVESTIVESEESGVADKLEVNNVAYVKATFGIARSLNVRIEMEYDINFDAWKAFAHTLFGVKVIRNDYGVLVKAGYELED